MSKILDWIKKHIWQTILIGFGLFFLPLIFVHIAYRIPAISPWFASTWEPGELITYIAGFEAFIGTVVLGAVAIHQNDRSNELNERMLKAEEKRDQFERQPIINISEYTCEIVADCELHVKKPAYDSMIYAESQPYTITPDENLNPNHIFLTFNMSNISAHPFTFYLERVSVARYEDKSKLITKNFILVGVGNETSRLLPNQIQRFILKAHESTFPDNTFYIIQLTFKYTNFLGEDFKEQYNFLLNNRKEKNNKLHFLGKVFD